MDIEKCKRRCAAKAAVKLGVNRGSLLFPVALIYANVNIGVIYSFVACGFYSHLGDESIVMDVAFGGICLLFFSVSMFLATITGNAWIRKFGDASEKVTFHGKLCILAFVLVEILYLTHCFFMFMIHTLAGGNISIYICAVYALLNLYFLSRKQLIFQICKRLSRINA